MQKYYIRQRGRVTGPYELGQILKLRDQGRLTRVHELSNDQQAWAPAYEFDEVFRAYEELSEPELAMAPASVAISQEPSGQGVDWFYVFEGDRLGPVKKEQLEALVSQGEIKSDTLVWSTDLADWSPASTVPQVAHLLRPNKQESVEAISNSAAEASTVKCHNCGASIHPTATRCPTCGIARSSKTKKRSIYVALAIALGLIGTGIHNFYAGRTKEGLIQLTILGLQIGVLFWMPILVAGFVINAVWVLIECFSVTTDGQGHTME